MACNPNCKVVKMKSWKGIGHNNYDQVYKRGIREKWSVWVTITSWPPTQPQEIFPCFIILTHLPSFPLYPTLHWSCWLGQSSCWIQSKTIPLHWGAASLDGHSRQSHKAWHQKFGSSIAVLSKEHENDESLGKLDVGVPPRSPSICKVAWLEPVLNVVIFLLGLQGNQVHTVFPVWWIALNFPPLFFLTCRSCGHPASHIWSSYRGPRLHYKSNCVLDTWISLVLWQETIMKGSGNKKNSHLQSTS